MKKREKIRWLSNGVSGIMVLIVIFFGVIIGANVWLQFHPFSQLWAFVVSWSIGVVLLIMAMAAMLVFWIGIGDEHIVFVKLSRPIRIHRSEIASVDIRPPPDSSDLERQYYQTFDRSVTLVLKSGESIKIGTLDGTTANKLHVIVMGVGKAPPL